MYPFTVPVSVAKLKQGKFTDEFCDEWADGVKSNVIDMFNHVGTIPSISALVCAGGSLSQFVFNLSTLFEEEDGPLLATEFMLDFMSKNDVRAIIVVSEAWVSNRSVDSEDLLVDVEEDPDRQEILEVRLEKPESITSWVFNIVRSGASVTLGEEKKQDLTGCTVGALINLFQISIPRTDVYDDDHGNIKGKWN